MFSSPTVDYVHKSISVLQKNTSESLQALKISLLLDVLASEAPALAAVAVSEHTQELSLWNSLCTLHCCDIPLGLGAAERLRLSHRTWSDLKAKKTKASLIIIIQGWNNLYLFEKPVHTSIHLEPYRTPVSCIFSSGTQSFSPLFIYTEMSLNFPNKLHLSL